MAYQGYGRGLDLNVIRELNRIATSGLIPDLTILPDLDVKEGLRRKGKSSANDRFEREQIPFHQRVRSGYLEMAGAQADRWMVLDAALPVRKISDMIWGKVNSLLY
jgi:dTMP kinase